MLLAAVAFQALPLGGAFDPACRAFRGRGVDLVLNGHDHVYAVSRALKRIRYVVTDGGGAGL